jgi:hypothetical protein
MDNAAFWKLIDASRQASEGDPYAQIDALAQLLAELEPDDVVAFNCIFSQYHDQANSWDLWGAAYIIGGGCSDDGFMDFRGWLISRGEQVYAGALRDPESLVNVVTEEDDDCQVEGFQYIASQVWEEMTGRSNDDFPTPAFEGHAGPTGQAWDEDDLEARFPKLSKRFD